MERIKLSDGVYNNSLNDNKVTVSTTTEGVQTLVFANEFTYTWNEDVKAYTRKEDAWKLEIYEYTKNGYRYKEFNEDDSYTGYLNLFIQLADGVYNNSLNDSNEVTVSTTTEGVQTLIFANKGFTYTWNEDVKAYTREEDAWKLEIYKYAINEYKFKEFNESNEDDSYTGYLNPLLQLSDGVYNNSSNSSNSSNNTEVIVSTKLADSSKVQTLIFANELHTWNEDVKYTREEDDWKLEIYEYTKDGYRYKELMEI